MRTPESTAVGRTAGPPKRWKLALLLSCGIYPVITVVESLTEPWLRHLPLFLQFPLVVPVVVTTMVYVVLPLLHRWFGTWMAR
jgi:antibiotic biosynthesis monooxygenase (ABM) superfamily enzyme